MSSRTKSLSRRKFLKTGALAVGAVGAGTVAMPQVSRAQTATLRMQGSWGAKDVFNEMAMDYVDRVNKMAGNRLKIDYLVGGAVVHPFQVFDGVHGGQLDSRTRSRSTGTASTKLPRCSAPARVRLQRQRGLG